MSTIFLDSLGQSTTNDFTRWRALNSANHFNVSKMATSGIVATVIELGNSLAFGVNPVITNSTNTPVTRVSDVNFSLENNPNKLRQLDDDDDDDDDDDSDDSSSDNEKNKPSSSSSSKPPKMKTHQKAKKSSVSSVSGGGSISQRLMSNLVDHDIKMFVDQYILVFIRTARFYFLTHGLCVVKFVKNNMFRIWCPVVLDQACYVIHWRTVNGVSEYVAVEPNKSSIENASEKISNTCVLVQYAPDMATGCSRSPLAAIVPEFLDITTRKALDTAALITLAAPSITTEQVVSSKSTDQLQAAIDTVSHNEAANMIAQRKKNNETPSDNQMYLNEVHLEKIRTGYEAGLFNSRDMQALSRNPMEFVENTLRMNAYRGTLQNRIDLPPERSLVHQHLPRLDASLMDRIQLFEQLVCATLKIPRAMIANDARYQANEQMGSDMVQACCNEAREMMTRHLSGVLSMISASSNGEVNLSVSFSSLGPNSSIERLGDFLEAEAFRAAVSTITGIPIECIRPSSKIRKENLEIENMRITNSNLRKQGSAATAATSASFASSTTPVPMKRSAKVARLDNDDDDEDDDEEATTAPNADDIDTTRVDTKRQRNKKVVRNGKVLHNAERRKKGRLDTQDLDSDEEAFSGDSGITVSRGRKAKPSTKVR